MSLNKQEIAGIFDVISNATFRLIIQCEDGSHADQVLNQVVNAGYTALLQSSAFCSYEVVITGERDGDLGPSWTKICSS